MEKNQEKTYQLVTDGSCDLGTELAASLDIEVVPFYVSLDGETYKKEIEEMEVREFYQFMVDHPTTFPKSSLPSVEDYVTVFTKYAKENLPVICICITSKFSGSVNSAMNARELVLEDYPEAQIAVIDSTINTVLQGTMMQVLAANQQAGASYEEQLEVIEQIKSTGRIFFTVENINYLSKGGRLGKLAGIATGTLNLKPLIVLKEGEIFPAGITRGRNKAKVKIYDQTIKYIKENGNDPDLFAINVGYGYDRTEGEDFQQKFIQRLKQEWPDAKAEVGILQIGATIGVHTGPHPLGFGIIKKAK